MGLKPPPFSYPLPTTFLTEKLTKRSNYVMEYGEKVTSDSSLKTSEERELEKALFSRIHVR
ncbi:hypothetical protein [Okeania sp. KiyG1]|uniref:hypothetical protein n=1 Tax=Okeania sp. KiyG1 TaxID=2720165 RepID=UPI001922C500|nr:hypothetical protein [Okeania sp. KiyG1]GGA38825.1 hypothetical protein CYANOKiyG1_56980 [Okeania sp. KiyG1]